MSYYPKSVMVQSAHLKRLEVFKKTEFLPWLCLVSFARSSGKHGYLFLGHSHVIKESMDLASCLMVSNLQLPYRANISKGS